MTTTRTVTLREDEWSVRRQGRIQELHSSDGRVTYRVKIWDFGREAFTTVNFNDEVPAQEFFDRIKRDNLAAFDEPDLADG